MGKNLPKPHVSVIVTAYNSGEWLSDTLASYEAQTYSNSSLIVIDDGSRVERSNFISKETYKIKGAYYEKTANQGLSAARNNGVELGRGELIAFLDHDDIWHPSFLEKLVEEFSLDCNMDAIFCRVEFINEHGKKTGATSRPKLENIELADFLISDPTSCGSSIIIKRSVFQELGGFNHLMKRAEIPEFFIRFLLNGNKLKGLNSVLVEYRDVAGSLSKGFTLLRFRLKTLWLVVYARPLTGLNPILVSRFFLNQFKIILKGYGLLN